MASIALLNDVHDAAYVIQHHAEFDETILISTHAAVDDYLSVRGVHSKNLSTFLEQNELLEFYAEADWVNTLLRELDTEFATVLSIASGITVPLSFFHAYYRYLGRYEYLSLLKVKTALKRLAEKSNPAQAILFHPHSKSSAPTFFDTDIDVNQLALSVLGVPVKRIHAPEVVRLPQHHNLMRPLPLLLRRAREFFRDPKKLFRRSQPAGGGREIVAIPWKEPSGLVVSLDGKRSLSLLPPFAGERLKDAYRLEPDVDSLNSSGCIPEEIRARALQAREELGSLSEFDPKKILPAILLDDFVRRFGREIEVVRRFDALVHQYGLLGCVWVSPPNRPGLKPLLIEYMLKTKVPVIGRQHGGNYGLERSYPRHFDSDYRWCSHYLSYGFTEADLKETCPDAEIDCRIIPVGRSLGASENVDRRERVDILFPISNATQFNQDALRPLQHDRAQVQWELLEYLDQLPNVRVIVKPFPGYNHSNSAFIEKLSRLQNIEVLETVSFTTSLARFKVGAVLIEYASSPLFECLQEDVDVLALGNSLLPFNSTAEALLRKRAYIFEDLSALKQGIDDFLAGHLPPRRDSGFVDRYLHVDADDRGRKAVSEIIGIGYK